VFAIPVVRFCAATSPRRLQQLIPLLLKDATMFFGRLAFAVSLASATLLRGQESTISGHVLDPQDRPHAASDSAYLAQLSGSVADASGAVIAGAAVQLWSADGTAERTTQTDARGAFMISGLAPGDYRLVVSKPDFETKEIPLSRSDSRSARG